VNKLRFFAKSLIHGAIDLSGRSRRQRRSLRGKLIILTYHSFCKDWPRGLFNSLPVHRFEKQIRFLKKKFNFVSLQQGLENLKLGRSADKPYLAITIDDGFQDNYIHALPILQSYDVPATIFLATDFIDTGRPPWPTQIIEILERTKNQVIETPFRAELRSLAARGVLARKLKKDWSPLSPVERFERLSELRKHLGVDENTSYAPLTWNQVHKMRTSGICFGSHTVFHSILPDVDNSVVEQELMESKQRLEAKLQEPCVLFAYPDGKHDLNSRNKVATYEFLTAVTQDKGINQNADKQLELKRIEIPFHDPFVTFRLRASIAI
jgi:peptidoglycan/xylan/chitin deacetylase (PgdA/CDA1 family)